MSFADLPRGVILSEYVAIAHAFFDDKEGRFVNGVMDAVAGDVRPGTG